MRGPAAIALALAFPPAHVRTLVEAQISRTLRREARFGRAACTLWPPIRLTVEDAALAEPGGFAAGTALRAVAARGLEWAESKARPGGVRVVADVDPVEVL